MKCPPQLSPSEYAVEVLQALLPYYAPLVVYVISAITVLMCIFLIFVNWRRGREQRAMVIHLQAMAAAFAAYQEASGKALEDAAMVQRVFNTETLAVQKAHAARQEAQMEALTGVLDRFLEQAVRVSPRGLIAVGSSTAPPEESEPG